MIVLMMSAPSGDTITPPSSFRSLPSEPFVQSLRLSVFSLSTFAFAQAVIVEAEVIARMETSTFLFITQVF